MQVSKNLPAASSSNTSPATWSSTGVKVKLCPRQVPRQSGIYWLAMIAAQSAAAKEKMAATRQTAGGSRPGAGRPAKKETFPGIAPCLEEFAAGHDYQADRRRRSHETRAEGFRLVDTLHHLYENFPELYEAGMSKDTVARIFTAPRKKTVAGGKYYAAVNARVAPTTNNARLENEATHFARTQQKLLREWHAYHGQPCASGDDMNIIQVGRPAVSRYHRNRKYFRGGKGIDAMTCMTFQMHGTG